MRDVFVLQNESEFRANAYKQDYLTLNEIVIFGLLMLYNFSMKLL